MTDTFYNEKNLIFSVNNLFGAGTDTTAATLRWGLLLMAKYPHIQGAKRDVDLCFYTCLLLNTEKDGNTFSGYFDLVEISTDTKTLLMSQCQHLRYENMYCAYSI